MDYTTLKPTIKQRNIIKFIEVNLRVKFKGTSAQEAYDFIGLYHKEADNKYKLEGGKQDHIRKANRTQAYIQEWSDYYDKIGAHPFDYGVPNC